MNLTLSQFNLIKSEYMIKGTTKINELGGSFKATDLNGQMFTVDYFHGENPCYGDVHKAWISKSDSNVITI